MSLKTVLTPWEGMLTCRPSPCPRAGTCPVKLRSAMCSPQVSHAWGHSLCFSNKVRIANGFNSSEPYGSLKRGFYHYEAAHLIKAFRGEGAVPGSNGLIPINIKWTICLRLVHKCLDLLSRQARHLLELLPRTESIAMPWGFFSHSLSTSTPSH